MNRFTRVLASATLATLILPFSAWAQDAATEGEVSSPSPRIMDPGHPGYFEIGAGAAMGFGMGSDGVLYNVHTGYNHNFSDRFTGKVLADLNLGTGTDTSRFAQIGLGGDIYLSEIRPNYGVPYATALVGYGFARTNDELTEEGLSLGGGVGFKFAAADTNLDLSLVYSTLTTDIGGDVPSVLGVRAALNF